MLNTGLDKFLKANMKSLQKQEDESRESQINMIDRGLDRISELLIFSLFVELTKITMLFWKGKSLRSSKNCKKISSLQDKGGLFDHFPIGLDVEVVK